MTPDGFARAADRLGFKVGPADLDATTLAHLPVPFLALYGDRPPRAVLSREGGSFVTLIPETGAVDLLVADDLADGATGALMLRPEAARQVVQRNWMTAAFERVKWVIVELLAIKAQELLNDTGVRVTRVRLWETPNGSAEWTE